MKKNSFIILLFFCVFIFSVFSGCNESLTNNNNSNNFQILWYNVTTEWSTGCTCDNTYEYHIEQGFYNTIYQRYNANYTIKGEIKNTANKDIDSLKINVKFLDKNNTILFDTQLLNATYNIYNLSQDEITSFLIQVNPDKYNYSNNPDFYNQLREKFQIVISLKFDISIF